MSQEIVEAVKALGREKGIAEEKLMAALAEGTTYTSGTGPTQIKAQGQTLVFDPIPTLAVRGEMVYRVRVRGNVAGDMRLRVQLTCDQVRTPVVKEESTRFYKE